MLIYTQPIYTNIDLKILMNSICYHYLFIIHYLLLSIK